MLEAKVVTSSIPCSAQAVYDAIWMPEIFPVWASGLSSSGMKRDGEIWTAQGPEGPIRIRFTDRNLFGVMDHWVDLGGADADRREWGGQRGDVDPVSAALDDPRAVRRGRGVGKTRYGAAERVGAGQERAARER